MRGRHNAADYASQEDSPPADQASEPAPDVPVDDPGQHMDDRVHVTIQDGQLEPGSKISRILRDCFLNRVDEEGWAWKKVSQDTKDFYWSEFQKNCFWYPDTSEAVVKRKWSQKAAVRYRDMVNEFRTAPERGVKNIPESVWTRWNQYWQTPEFKGKSALASQNRRGKSSIPSVHTGGSISASAHARRLAKEIGRHPTPTEVFRRIHTRKGDGVTWADERSRHVYESIENIRSQESQPESESGSTEARPVDEADIYIRAAGGFDRSRIYGLGSLSSFYMERASGESTSAAGPSGVDHSSHQELQELVHSQQELVHRQQIRLETQETQIETLRSEMGLMRDHHLRMEEHNRRMEEQNRRLEELMSQFMAAQQTGGPCNQLFRPQDPHDQGPPPPPQDAVGVR